VKFCTSVAIILDKAAFYDTDSPDVYILTCDTRDFLARFLARMSVSWNATYTVQAMR